MEDPRWVLTEEDLGEIEIEKEAIEKRIEEVAVAENKEQLRKEIKKRIRRLRRKSRGRYMGWAHWYSLKQTEQD